jgi:Cof subfamily protein (haloacid dehalogenase superfamily)
MKKLFCFDLDMTLLDHKTMAITPSALCGIQKLKEQGHLIAVCSGRDLESPFSRKFTELIRPDAVVQSNGQKVTAGRKILREQFMDQELVQRLIHYGEEKKICIGFHIGEKGAFVLPEIVREREKRTFGNCDKDFLPVSALLEEKLYALVLFGKNPEDTIKKAAMVEKAFPEIKCALFSGNAGADVICRGMSKADGIACLLEYYSMDFSDVIAFGDSMNDWEMIREAGCGIAMGNAVMSLKEQADFVTKPIGEDGIWYALKTLGWIST